MKLIQTFLNTCIECDNEINNPLCPSCLSRDIKAWLIAKNSRKTRVIDKELKNILSRGEQLSSSQCIACKKNRAFLCPSCLILLTSKIMKKNKINNNIIQEFLDDFNFKN